MPAGVPGKTSWNLLGTIVDKGSILAKQDPYEKDDKGMFTVDAMNSWFRPEHKGFSTQFSISKKVYDGTTDDVGLTWEEYHTLDYLKDEFRKYSSTGKLSGFYQEYYNIPATESNPVINVDAIRIENATFKTVGKITYLEYPDKKKVPCRVYIGVDPAVKTGHDCSIS